MLFLLPIFIFLFSCSENLYYNETAPHISIEILTPSASDTILAGDSVYFEARKNPPSAFVKIFYWSVDTKERPVPSWQFPEVFKKSGVYNARFYAIDVLGDTLSEGLTISVGNKPICDSLTLNIVYGSPIFKWKCEDIDGDKLSYNFLLKNGNRTIVKSNLQENFLQLGDTLSTNSWEVRIIAINSLEFKDTLEFKYELDPIWEAP